MADGKVGGRVEDGWVGGLVWLKESSLSRPKHPEKNPV